MKRLCTLSAFFLCCWTGLQAQVQRAYLDENYGISVELLPEIERPLTFRNETFSQMAGFPKGARANKVLKNFRNVTLVDLNRDGAQDIIWGANSRLFADSYDRRLWARTLSGIAIYPASVADLDKDGDPEIIQATGGSQTSGRLYALNKAGEDLPGWPLNFDGHWILTAPAISDVNDDGDLEIIFNERDSPKSRLHIVGANGLPFSDRWPVSIFGPLAVTPSIGDVDGDGAKEIFVTTTTTRYLFNLNGEPEPGWPMTTDPAQRYSYQSSLLVDLDEDGDLEIIGATHGNQPEYYILQADNTYFPGWPKPIPGNSWTFNTPTAVKIDGEYRIFMSRPIDERTGDMLYGWNANGRSLSNFPLFRSGGLEGFISIADVDGDDEFELVCGSNLLLDGRSFIHAYNLDDLTEVPGFPIRPWGWTFMNGVNIGDVNGDGMMDLVSLTYTQNFSESAVDSTYLNVYELRVPYSPERVLWGSYKGNNTREGLLTAANVTPIREREMKPAAGRLSLSPNPVGNRLQLELVMPKSGIVRLDLYNMQGHRLAEIFREQVDPGLRQWSYAVNHLPTGMYCINVRMDHQTVQTLRFVKK